jgi:cysteine-rich repeat protein
MNLFHSLRRRPVFQHVALIALSISALSASAANPDLSGAAPDQAPKATSQQVHSARLGPRLKKVMEESLQDATQREAAAIDLVAIRVTLKRDDLEIPGRRRRASVRARQDRVLGMAANGLLELTYRYESLSGFAGRASPGMINALRKHPEVTAIHLDYEVHGTLAEGNALIGADAAHSTGITGVGVIAAVLDSGIDTDHPDLADDLVAEQCFCNDSPSPRSGCCPSGGISQGGPGSAEDDNGHGTHTAGIITSAGVVSDQGVAPDAGIVAIKVLNENGSGRTSGVAAALDWVVTNHLSLGIKVVNLSLGDGGEHNNPLASPCSGTSSANAVSLLHAAGVVVFAASGNDAYEDGISEPACITQAISVGGVYDASVGRVGWCGNASCSEILCSDTTGPDVFVCHSNSDEILDILAPDWRTTSPELGGGTAAFGGTSAASPYAAGQAALLLEVDPSLQPEEIRTLLKTNGTMVTNPGNGLAFRRSDVEIAIGSLSVCGDGVSDLGESCDDGNVIDGDCCSSTCEFEPVGTSCDDADACTDFDTCDGGGGCSSGGALDCDDLNSCTDDSCDSSVGCLNVNNSAACDDGNACTTNDLCSSGACMAGFSVECDDTNACTDDACDPMIGCVFSDNAAPCDDGNACTASDHCSTGSCLGGTPLECDDSNVCTEDSCDSVSGCVFTEATALCDDADPCTAESCDEITGCAHSPIIGCPAAVPGGSTGSRGLLLALILGSFLILSGDRWLQMKRG